MKEKSDRFFGTYEDMVERFQSLDTRVVFSKPDEDNPDNIVYSDICEIPDLMISEKGVIEFTQLWFVYIQDSDPMAGIWFRPCTIHKNNCLLYGEISTCDYDVPQTRDLYKEVARSLFKKCKRSGGWKVMPGAYSKYKEGMQLTMSCLKGRDKSYSDIEFE